MPLERYEDLPVKWHFDNYSVMRDDGLIGKIATNQEYEVSVRIADSVVWSTPERWRFSTITAEDRSRVIVLVLIDVLTSAKRTKKRLCKALTKNFPEGKQRQALIQLIETGHTYNLNLSQEEFKLAASIFTR
jgi:hypothetical protein